MVKTLEIDDESRSAGMFAFPVPVYAILAHMRQDMRDDWFPDPLDYNDLFAPAHKLDEILSSLLLEGNGRYEGVLRTLCDIPKKGLGLRYALVEFPGFRGHFDEGEVNAGGNKCPRSHRPAPFGASTSS